MKLLLTSNGITNDTLAHEIEELAGKPFDELEIGFIPSAAFGDPSEDKGWLIDDLSRLCSRGAKVAIVSLADLTPDEIIEQLADKDVIFVGGGVVFYLSWLMQQKGLFDRLPSLLENKVYAGISAGSMVASIGTATASQAIRTGEVRDDLGPQGRSSAKTLGLVPFLVRPHYGDRLTKEINGGALEKISKETGQKIYAVSDQCAVKVVDSEVTVVGDGEWRIIEPKV